MTEVVLTPELADYHARCFVNGVRRHGVSGKLEPASGEFHERFLHHPWVRESITEDWARELRGHLIHVVRRRIMAREPYHEIETLMPDRKWVDDAKHNAARYGAAKKQRDAKFGKADGVAFLRAIGIKPPWEKSA